jgi:hypothetical protein
MPLSDEEEKILAQIEAGIKKTDPGLAQHVEQTNLYRYSGRRIAFSILGIIALLALMVVTFTNAWPVAFVSFAIMVVIGISLVDHIVKIGRASVDDAKKQAQKMNSRRDN